MSSVLSSFFRQRMPLGWVALLRLFLGVMFTLYGYQKVFAEPFAPGLGGLLTKWTEGMHIAWYKSFLLNTAIPNAHLFGWLVAWGEFLVGIAFLLGALTRLAAAAALFMNLNYLLATWHMGPPSQGVNLSFLMMEFVVLATAAGRALGVDAWLSRKWRKVPLW